jgi:hypothetical protein
VSDGRAGWCSAAATRCRAAERPSVYAHRAAWRYSFAGWGLTDATLVLVQDELDIQFGMDVTLWVQPAGTSIQAPVRYE